MNSGYVYLGEHSGWYSVSDECFYTDSQVRTEDRSGVEVKVSIETGNVVEWTKEENYKFALSKFKAPLLQHFKANPDGKCHYTLGFFIDPNLAQRSTLRIRGKTSWTSLNRPIPRLFQIYPFPGPPGD